MADLPAGVAVVPNGTSALGGYRATRDPCVALLVAHAGVSPVRLTCCTSCALISHEVNSLLIHGCIYDLLTAARLDATGFSKGGACCWSAVLVTVEWTSTGLDFSTNIGNG